MASSLNKKFEQQLAQVQQLEQLLEQELALISAREPDALLDVVKQKEVLIEAIQTVDNDIKFALGKLRANADTDAGAELLDDDASALKASIEAVIENCRHKTAVNQAAVEQGQLRVSHLRNLMMEVRAKESLTYNKSGKPTGAGSLKGIKA